MIIPNILVLLSHDLNLKTNHLMQILRTPMHPIAHNHQN